MTSEVNEFTNVAKCIEGKGCLKLYPQSNVDQTAVLQMFKLS